MELGEAYFRHLKEMEDGTRLETMMDEKITAALMQGKKDTREIKAEIKQELQRELREDIYRIVRECLRTEPLNIKIKY